MAIERQPLLGGKQPVPTYVGKVIQLAAVPVLALGIKGLLKPYAKGPFKL